MDRETQAERIHRMQRDKKEAFFGVGDIVKIKGGKEERYEFLGEITCIEIRLQEGELHPIMDLQCIRRKPDGTLGEYEDGSWGNAQASIWIESITDLEIIRWKDEVKL